MGLFHEVKCGKCDRRYSSIRSRCPYCGARKSQAGRTGTKDHKGTQTTQQIIGIVILIIVIVAVVVLVASSLKNRDENPDPSPSNSISGSGDVSGLEGSAPPTTPPPPETTPPVETPTPTPTIIINSITLNRDDFTLSYIGETWDLSPVISPAGADVVIEWRSTDPTVASVDENGIVTAVDRGNVTVTATVGDVQAKCIVRVSADAPDTPSTGDSGSSSGSSSGPASLSHTDVTINAGISETFRLTVSGSSETPSYSVGNSSVATVDSNGKVTAVGSGKTTVTVKVGDQELSCIVRVTS